MYKLVFGDLNCYFYTIFNGYQTSFSLFWRHVQSIYIKFWMESTIDCEQLSSFSIYLGQLTVLKLLNGAEYLKGDTAKA